MNASLGRIGPVLALAALLGACTPAPAPAPAPAPNDDSAAGMTLEHFYALSGDAATVIVESDWDVIVATVKSVSTHEATNARPPLVELEIHEVLRGDRGADRRKAVWEPFPHDVDWSGPGSDEAIRQWESQPMRGPAPGERWILVGQWQRTGNASVFGASPAGRFPYSPQKRDWAMKAVEDGAARH